jgi:hypothetical protein
LTDSASFSFSLSLSFSRSFSLSLLLGSLKGFLSMPGEEGVSEPEERGVGGWSRGVRGMAVETLMLPMLLPLFVRLMFVVVNECARG